MWLSNAVKTNLGPKRLFRCFPQFDSIYGACYLKQSSSLHM